jgi:predicted ArsR family transcriptional regulator
MNVLDVIGDPELRETLLAVRRRPRAASISEIADATGVHRNVARRRLERLVAAGLLTSSFERPAGRTGPGAGRPAKVYSPTPDTTAIEFPGRGYPELVGLLVDALPTRRLSEIGVQFGRALASTAGVESAQDARTGLEGLCRALGDVGFQARVEHFEAGRAEIVTPTCPLRPLVVANPAVAEVDHALWRGLVAAAVDDVEVDDVGCETHDCLEPCASCRIVLSLGRPAGA